MFDRQISRIYAIAALILLAGCEPGEVDTSTPTAKFSPVGVMQLYAICLDGLSIGSIEAQSLLVMITNNN